MAIATPASTVPFSLREFSSMPATPPKVAMSTSYMVGLVRARSSVCWVSCRGEIMKYRVDARMEISTITPKFLRDSLMRAVSLVPRPRPKPRIGPIRGDMSIAPMMTGMELRFSPTDAMMIAQARMKTFGPRKGTLLRMAVLAAPLSMWSDILTSPLNCLTSLTKSSFMLEYLC